MSIDTKTLQALICAPGLAGRRGLRALLWGTPGTGKTAKVEALVDAMGAHCITIIASIREPSDFLGLPIPDGKGVRYAAPGWAIDANTRAEKGQIVVVFLDELTTCAPSVQAAMLRMVNEGFVGDLKLHPDIVFLAAANPPECAVGGYDLAPPMANRWIHLDWDDPTPSEYAEGLVSNWASTYDIPSAQEFIDNIDKNYANALASAKGLVSSFVQSSGQPVVKLPSNDDPNASRAWPSLRTWDMVVRALAAGEAANLNEVDVDRLVAGAVGAGPAAAFRQYIVNMDLPRPDALLDAADPSKLWKPDPQRPDVTHAVLESCVALVAPTDAEKRIKRASAIFKMCTPMLKDSSDIVFSVARSLQRAGLVRVPNSAPVLKELAPMLVAAGLMQG